MIGYNMEKVAIALLLLSFTLVRLAPTTIVAVWVGVFIFYVPTYSGSPSKTGVRSLSDRVPFPTRVDLRLDRRAVPMPRSSGVPCKKPILIGARDSMIWLGLST